MRAMKYATKTHRAFIYADVIRVQVPYAPSSGRRLKQAVSPLFMRSDGILFDGILIRFEGDFSI